MPAVPVRSSGGAGGFTLIELLVALLVSGILAGVIFQVLAGQSRFAELQSARAEVQQNGRAVLEVITDEARTVPLGGIEAAAADSVVLRVPRAWGVICSVGASATGPVQLAVPGGLDVNYRLPTGPSSATSYGVHPRFVAEAEGTPAWTASTPVTAVGPGASSHDPTCESAGGEVRVLTLQSIAGLAPGQVGYLYDLVAYTAAKSKATKDVWIRRRVGPEGTPQPMAGPVRGKAGAGGGGLRFRYFDETGSPLPFVAGVLSPENAARVRRIDIVVETVGRLNTAGANESELDSTTVFLRNRS